MTNGIKKEKGRWKEKKGINIKKKEKRKRNYLWKVKDVCHACDLKRLIHYEKVKSMQVKEKWKEKNSWQSKREWKSQREVK